MSYATIQDVIDILGQREAVALSDRAKTGQVDQVNLQRALDQATAEVDGYVGRRYKLPLTDAATGQPAVPKLLVSLAVDIARYRATGTEIVSTEQIDKRYDNAVAVLKNIAKGDLSLGGLVLAPAGGPAAVGGVSAVRTQDKTFSNLEQML